MKKTRQIISVFLSVCMIISCMAGFTFTVSAEDDPRRELVLCGGIKRKNG